MFTNLVVKFFKHYRIGKSNLKPIYYTTLILYLIGAIIIGFKTSNWILQEKEKEKIADEAVERGGKYSDYFDTAEIVKTYRKNPPSYGLIALLFFGVGNAFSYLLFAYFAPFIPIIYDKIIKEITPLESLLIRVTSRNWWTLSRFNDTIWTSLYEYGVTKNDVDDIEELYNKFNKKKQEEKREEKREEEKHEIEKEQRIEEKKIEAYFAELYGTFPERKEPKIEEKRIEKETTEIKKSPPLTLPDYLNQLPPEYNDLKTNLLGFLLELYKYWRASLCLNDTTSLLIVQAHRYMKKQSIPKEIQDKIIELLPLWAIYIDSFSTISNSSIDEYFKSLKRELKDLNDKEGL